MGKGGRGRTVPLHPALFANWSASYGPRDYVVGLTRKMALRHLRAGIEHAGLDEESPGTGLQRAGLTACAQCGPSLADLREDPAERGLAVAGACDLGGRSPY